MRKLASSRTATPLQQELAALRISYSEDSKLLTGYINRLVNVDRVYPRHLPTQKSGRWSTFDPPLTNWPRACINPACSQDEHEWLPDICWSVRDILLPDDDEVLISWDHDAVESRIYDIIVNDEKAIAAHTQGLDSHTITCCDIFGYPYPSNLRDPHTAPEDAAWRREVQWRGKDTRQRVLAKNFVHGSKYTETYRFVHKIPGIEKYGIAYKDLAQLAKTYIASKGAAWDRKLALMATIRKERMARSLYGFRRVFYASSPETGREGLSHMVSATVSDYHNMTFQLFERTFGDAVRLLHNSHDGGKLCIKKTAYDSTSTFDQCKQLIERPVEYEGRTITLTAGVKIYGV